MRQVGTNDQSNAYQNLKSMQHGVGTKARGRKKSTCGATAYCSDFATRDNYDYDDDDEEEPADSHQACTEPADPGSNDSNDE